METAVFMEEYISEYTKSNGNSMNAGVGGTNKQRRRFCNNRRQKKVYNLELNVSLAETPEIDFKTYNFSRIERKLSVLEETSNDSSLNLFLSN